MEQVTAATVDGLREALGALKLDTRGHKAVLKKRLRTAKKSLTTSPGNDGLKAASTAQHIESWRPTRPSSQDFDSYCVLDFEATCQQYVVGQGSRFDFPNEIIEFPVLLLQWKYKENGKASDCTSEASSSASSSSTSSQDELDKANDPHNWELVVVDEFRRFVRPTWRPKLSTYCTQLTGITQSDIDTADTFLQVLQEFKASFIKPHKLFTKHNKTAWVTDGPWDLRDFVAKQCYISFIERPSWLKGPYIDLRSSATAYLARKLPVVISPVEGSESIDDEGYITTTKTATLITIPTTRGLATPNIPAVLKALNLEPFEGRQHSGIDDVRNIARILQELVKPERNWRVEANARIEGKDKSYYWMRRDGRVAWEHPLDD